MMFWLVMRATNGEERRFPLDKPRTLIGRETRCDVRIPIPAVDKRHCEIILESGDLRLTDLNSTRGTFHNGARVETVSLTHQDEVTIGPVTFTVRAQEVEEADGPVSEVRITRFASDGGAAAEPA
ncbi:MAG: FHA domain-containing protein [Planctomycetota bacterium]|jgi:pSer/pThr/pTyr-binding forkhead associated (FHA) protein